MKTIRSWIPIILLAFPSALWAERPSCEITAFCYSMTAKDAIEFTLTYNPAGQAIQSMAELDGWVEKKRAVSMGSIFTTGESGLRLDASGKEFSLETETVVSSDASCVDIVSKVVFLDDQSVGGKVACNNHQIVFAGNSTPKDHGSNANTTVYFVYLLSKITKR